MSDQFYTTGIHEPTLPVNDEYTCGCFNGLHPVTCSCSASQASTKLYGVPHELCNGTGFIYMTCPNPICPHTNRQASAPPPPSRQPPPGRSSRNGHSASRSSRQHHATSGGR